jgi:hypothetical protein
MATRAPVRPLRTCCGPSRTAYCWNILNCAMGAANLKEDVMRWPTTIIIVLGTLVSIRASQDVVAQPDLQILQSCKASDLTRYDTEGYVVGFSTGWTPLDTMSVRLDADFRNAEGCVPLGSLGISIARPCPVTDAGYALDPTDNGVKLHEAVLLSAFLTGQKVHLLLHDCAFGKPRIISVGMGRYT